MRDVGTQIAKDVKAEFGVTGSVTISGVRETGARNGLPSDRQGVSHTFK